MKIIQTLARVTVRPLAAIAVTCSTGMGLNAQLAAAAGDAPVLTTLSCPAQGFTLSVPVAWSNSGSCLDGPDLETDDRSAEIKLSADRVPGVGPWTVEDARQWLAFDLGMMDMAVDPTRVSVSSRIQVINGTSYLIGTTTYTNAMGRPVFAIEAVTGFAQQYKFIAYVEDPNSVQGKQTSDAVAASLASLRLLDAGRTPFTVQIGCSSGGDMCDAVTSSQDDLLTAITLPGAACQARITFLPGNSHRTLAPQTADGFGELRWHWRAPAGVISGTAVVTCVHNHQIKHSSQDFVVWDGAGTCVVVNGKVVDGCKATNGKKG
jgi:hypothetical protein